MGHIFIMALQILCEMSEIPRTNSVFLFLINHVWSTQIHIANMPAWTGMPTTSSDNKPATIQCGLLHPVMAGCQLKEGWGMRKTWLLFFSVSWPNHLKRFIIGLIEKISNHASDIKWGAQSGITDEVKFEHCNHKLKTATRREHSSLINRDTSESIDRIPWFALKDSPRY